MNKIFEVLKVGGLFVKFLGASENVIESFAMADKSVGWQTGMELEEGFHQEIILKSNL